MKILILNLVLVVITKGCAQSIQKTKINPVDGLQYVYIPSGSFLMGCVPSDTSCWEEEKPQHRVHLTKGFWISETEVTVEAFRKFVESTGYLPQSEKEYKGRMYKNHLDDWEWTSGLTWKTPIEAAVTAEDNWPVAQISWTDAQAYCFWAGGNLPTEAQWEYACRGGKANELFLWGNSWLPEVNGEKYENGPDETMHLKFPKMEYWKGYNDGYVFYAPVGSFEPNGYGLYDMSGNVWEWCTDWFVEDLFTTEERVDPEVTKIVKHKSKIIRGGAWCYSPNQHRNSERGVIEAEDFWAASIGFRCVLKEPTN